MKETLECIVTGQYIVPDKISKLGIDFLRCLINKVSKRVGSCFIEFYFIFNFFGYLLIVDLLSRYYLG